MTDDALNLRSPLVNHITKPPRISPAEAIAFTLQIALCLSPRELGPHSRTVKLILQALELTDYKIVPR